MVAFSVSNEPSIMHVNCLKRGNRMYGVYAICRSNVFTVTVNETRHFRRAKKYYFEIPEERILGQTNLFAIRFAVFVATEVPTFKRFITWTFFLCMYT